MVDRETERSGARPAETVHVASASPYDVTIGRGVTATVAAAVADGGPLAGASRIAVLHQPAVTGVASDVAAGVRRTGLSPARPLLAGVNPRATFAALLAERLPVYRSVAAHEVATDALEPEAVAEAVHALIGPEVASRG